MKVRMILTLCFGCVGCLCAFLGNFEPKYSPLFANFAVFAFGTIVIMAFINFLALAALLFKKKGLGFMPFCISIAFICLFYLFQDCGTKVWCIRFQKRLPEYQEVVQDIEKGKITEDSNKVHGPLMYKHMPYFIFADRDPNGILTIEFAYQDRAFGRRGALYRADDNPNKWQYMDNRTFQKIIDNWYRIN